MSHKKKNSDLRQLNEKMFEKTKALNDELNRVGKQVTDKAFKEFSDMMERHWAEDSEDYSDNNDR